MGPIETALAILFTILLGSLAIAVTIALAIVIIGVPLLILWGAFVFLQGRALMNARAAAVLQQKMELAQAMIGEIVVLSCDKPSLRRIIFITGGRIYALHYNDLGVPWALLGRDHGEEHVLALSCFQELWPLFDALSGHLQPLAHKKFPD